MKLSDLARLAANLAGGMIVGLATGSVAHAAPTYIVSGGKLTEIDGIEISGLGTWDAVFVDGSFESIFGSAAGLDFTNFADASKATAALEAALVGDAGQPGWNLDTQPDRVSGCSQGLFLACSPLTPIGISFNTFVSAFLVDNALFDNLTSVADLLPYQNQTDLDFDTTLRADLVYVDWKRNGVAAAVPAPGSAGLLAAALLAYLLLGWRRRQRPGALLPSERSGKRQPER